MRTPLAALVGNPNTGKTTLFNRLTGSRARVGNYPGVTVDRREGSLADGSLRVLDVPGTYSLVGRSAEERIAVDAMLGLGSNEVPDAVVVCLDATQLVRSCYLLLQLQELGLPVLAALTMVDEAGPGAVAPEALAQVLGCPVVPVNGPRAEGLDALARAMNEVVGTPRLPTLRWTPSSELRVAVDRARDALPDAWPASDALAIWALMSFDASDAPGALAQALDGLDGEAVDTEVVTARYGWLDEHVAPLVEAAADRSWTRRVDRVLLHPVAGFAAFLVTMFVVFQALFAWSDPAIGAVEDLFGWLGGVAATALPEGLFADFVVDALIGGVGGVLVFLPQIVLLFFFLGLMEDSGYMARVAYLMDRVMKAMNLHGRAFVPMLSGFACAVPAVMATRTMERKRDRLLTMLVVPLMTCSARLPVYTLLIGALFPATLLMGFLPLQGTAMVGMYLFSTLVALGAAWVLGRAVPGLRAGGTSFVMELPPYRLPRLSDVVRMMVERSWLFVREAGTVILACTVALWLLLTFPQVDGSAELDAALAAGDEVRVEQLELELAGRQLRESYAGRLGQAIEPAIEPLGFDWKMGVGLIGAFAAREVFVATMGVVYNVGDEVDEASTSLRERMKAETHPDGTPVYTPLVGLSLMIFFALACQCMSTLAVVKRETKGYRWPVFLFVYMTALAWVASFVVYQGGRLLTG